MKVKVNFSIEEETDEHLEELGKLLYRTKGGMIDYLVAKAWDEKANLDCDNVDSGQVEGEVQR